MENNSTLLAKIFIIQKMFEKLSKTQRLNFYNTAVKMENIEIADIMLGLIENMPDDTPKEH
jgi:hypothetical protein